MKKTLFGLLIIGLISGAIYAYLFYLSPVKINNPLNAVPSNAAVIIQFEDPFEQWNKFTSNEIWTYLKTNPHLSLIGHRVDSANDEIRKNKKLWQLVAARPMMVSIHQIRNNEYDYLFVVDLQKASQFNFLINYIDQLTDDNDKILRRDYHGEEIIELKIGGSPKSVYMTLSGNLFSISMTHTLIEQSIDQRDEPVIVRDLNFIDVSNYIDEDEITMFLQHQFFTNFVKQWFSEDESAVLSYFESLIYSGINFNMSDDHFAVTGLSNMNNSIPTLFNGINQSGKGKTQLAKIAPNNTSFFMSIGFNDMVEYYSHLEESIVATGENEEYLEDKMKLEKFLGINIERHFLSWVDDEVGLIQTNSDNSSSAIEYAVAVKYRDINEAKENLNFIKNQIRKKTPVKFRGIEYKGHEINYLSIKGFFKILFGKTFSKVEKPYYTFIDDYVVFSNSPRTLGKIITAYYEKSTLNHNDAFVQYMDRFDAESSLFIYANPKQLIADSKNFLDSKSYNEVINNREYIESFPMIGVQFTPEGKLLSYDIIFEYLSQTEMIDWNSLFIPNIQIMDTLFVNTVVTEEPIAVDDIIPEDFNDKVMNDHFANGQLKFEVSLKNGMKHGSYHEYDSLGNVIIKGRYKNDQKSGVWKYYSSDGDLLKKEKY